MSRDVGRRMRRAWVIVPRPYGHRSGSVTDGADIQWADIQRDPEHDRVYGSPSTGGWCYDLADGWDDKAADLDALGFILRCVGQYAADKLARETLKTSQYEEPDRG